MIFSLTWNDDKKCDNFWARKLVKRDLLVTEKFLFWNFRWWKIWSFFESRSWWKRWYLLITEKFFFWTFRWWEIRSFLSQEVDGKIIFTGYGKGIVLNFSGVINMVFLSTKKLMERWYLLITEKFHKFVLHPWKLQDQNCKTNGKSTWLFLDHP